MITRVALLAASWMPGAGAKIHNSYGRTSQQPFGEKQPINMKVVVTAGELEKTLATREGPVTRDHLTFPIRADTATSGAEAHAPGDVSDTAEARVFVSHGSDLTPKQGLVLLKENFEEEDYPYGFSEDYKVKGDGTHLFDVTLDCGHQAILRYDNARPASLKIETSGTDTVARIRDGDDEVLEIVTWVEPAKPTFFKKKWFRSGKKPITVRYVKNTSEKGLQYQRTLIAIRPDGTGRVAGGCDVEDETGRDYPGTFFQPVKLTTTPGDVDAARIRHHLDVIPGVPKAYRSQFKKPLEQMMKEIREKATAAEKPEILFPNLGCGNNALTMDPNWAVTTWMQSYTHCKEKSGIPKPQTVDTNAVVAPHASVALDLTSMLLNTLA